MNINLIILHMLELIRKSDFPSAIDRSDALRQYAYRHLNREETIRSRLFFDLLLCLEQGKFELDQIQAIAQPILEELTRHSLASSRQDFEVEVVPYGVLWRWVITTLEI